MFFIMILLNPPIESNLIPKTQIHNFFHFGKYVSIQEKKLDNIIWDNYGIDSDTVVLSSQFDNEYPFNSQVADDFILNNNKWITGVQWWGGYFGGTPPWPNPIDFYIIFYADDGTGMMPTGAGLDNATTTALAVYFLHDIIGTPTGLYDCYQYNVTFTKPFNITANTKYWIAIQAKFPIPPQWGWCTNGNNPDQMHSAVQGFPVLEVPFWTELAYGDMAFNLVGSNTTLPAKPDLDCNGQLSWTDTKPGATVTGSFQVMNIGDQHSLLNWTIASYPDWGTWTFTPSSGANLTPQDGAITVNVTVIAPDIKNQEFQGQVKVVNKENSSDYCSIPVTLTTPLNTYALFIHYWDKLLMRFPLLEELFSLRGNQLERNT
jgi:hypothetical protein